MTKFMYKMESILEIKYQLEEQVKTTYENAKMALTLEEEKLQGLIQKHKFYQEKLLNSIQTKLQLREIKQCEDALKLYNFHINQQQKKVDIALQKLEAARMQLQDAMKERKTHEMLKEKAFEEYMFEYEAMERKEIDELVSYRYGCVSNPGGDQWQQK